jgi:hypothetical protein
MAVNRWYVRCPGCLGLGVIEFDPGNNGGRPECEGCKQPMDVMGRVQGESWVREADASVCDDRCTTARGPKCACGCGGENHGIGLAAGTVRIIAESGRVVIRPVAADQAAERCAEWESARVDLRAEIEAKYPELAAYRAGEYLGGGGSARFQRYRDASDMLRQVRKGADMKSHAGRMKRLAEVRARMDRATV